MTILEKIRSKTTWLAIVVGIALCSFIMGDFLRSGSVFFGQNKENIAVVNGETINYRDYQEKVENYTNALRNNCKSLTDEHRYQIRQMILNEMIDDILLDKEIKKLGLIVSKEEYKNLILGENTPPIIQQIPYFQNPQTKKFDKTALLQFLQIIRNEDYSTYSKEQIFQLMSIKKAWLNIEKQIIKEQLKKKFNTLFAYSILANDLEAKAFYEENKTNVDFDYVTQSYNSIPDKEINVSDTEVQKLYNKCKKKYKQKEAVLIDFVALNIIPSQKDYQIIRNRFEDLKKQLESSKSISDIVQTNPDIVHVNTYTSYNNLSEDQKHFVDKHSVGEVVSILTNKTFNLYKFEGMKIAPDSIKLNILTIPSFSDKINFTHLCDSLIQIVKKGIPFADMALTFSKGKTTGELGWITETQLISQLDTQFKDKVLKAKINEPSIIKSNMGTFLIQVVEKTKPIKKYKIAHIQMRVTPSQETKARLYNKLNQFILSNHSIIALRKNAKSSGLSVQTDIEISKDQTHIKGIQNARQIVQWAFNNKKGTVSNVFECQNSEYFVVATVKEHLQEGYRSLASVFDMLKKELINEKKAKKIIANLKAKKLNTLKQYAKALNNATPQSVQSVNFSTLYIPNIGKEPILNVKALETPIKQISGPYAGKNGIYVLYITNKNISKEPYDIEHCRRQAQIQNMYRMYQVIQSTDFLRENVKIKNYFNHFF